MTQAAGKRFLRAAQTNALEELQGMLARQPSLLLARSSTKGYTAMHYAAMAGAIPVIEWLAQQGLSAEVDASGYTPLRVALEYKQMSASRRLQQLRDSSRVRLDEWSQATITA